LAYDALDIAAAQEHFGFASPAPVEKDWYILRAMQAIASVAADPFRLFSLAEPAWHAPTGWSGACQKTWISKLLHLTTDRSALRS
jgi:hypothetical protein